jgi:hypothetical protein
LCLIWLTNKLAGEYNTGTCEINALQFSADGKMLAFVVRQRYGWTCVMRKTFLLKTSFRAGTGGRKFSNISLF